MTALGDRIVGWVTVTTPSALLGLIVPVAIVLGMLAARHRVLENPAAHMQTLRRIAVVGLVIGFGTGAALALQNLNLLGLDRSQDPLLLPAHTVGGLFGGVGYVAVFGLLAAGDQPSGFGTAVRALGKRSLSGYLFQSVVFAPLLSAWAFGVGQHLSTWSAAALAVGVWVVSLVIARR